MLSLWYRYRDGTFHCATGASADRQTTRVTSNVRAGRIVPYQRDENSYTCRGVRALPALCGLLYLWTATAVLSRMVDL